MPVYFLNLEIIKIIMAITAATSNKPDHTPALKISPIAWQELKKNKTIVTTDNKV